MPEVRLEVPIEASIERVWATVVDVESYPTSMDHVRSVRVVERIGSNVRRAEWSVVLKGSILEWLEEDCIDPESYAITFKQLSGDLEYFDGCWRLEANGSSRTVVTFQVAFDIGIPSLADMLNPVAQRSLRENCTEMLLDIERRAAGV